MNCKTENLIGVILFVAIGLLVTISLVAAVYWQTRTKWYELGLSAGAIKSKHEIVAELCEYGAKALPPRTPDIQIWRKNRGILPDLRKRASVDFLSGTRVIFRQSNGRSVRYEPQQQFRFS